jgi:hypothetical protein
VVGDLARQRGYEELFRAAVNGGHEVTAALVGDVERAAEILADDGGRFGGDSAR